METKAQLRAERDHYKKFAEAGVGPIIKSMRLENGKFDLEVTGPIVEMISVAFVGQFKAGGATNFMEMSLYDRDEPYQRYILTVQKAGAKSPADKLRDAEARIAELEATN
jgi:hypothetical protein